ncbi:unnamed protein product [Adineta ricciae]|uniref:Uncharacterized protein n=1 Tax=Adineta ricciae TaxID=249248 RepID=A0A816FZU0_ADIRI|nr:unnamed protein product [Adineta ricciae]
MSYRSTLPTWYVNPLLNHGLNICTMCGSQSFVDIRIPICPQCDGIIADSPRNARYEHLCTNCSRRCTICRSILCFCSVLFATTTYAFPITIELTQGQLASQLALAAIQTGQWTSDISGSAALNSLNSYDLSGHANVSVPIYNGGSNQPSVGIGGTADASFGSNNGQLYGPNPNYDVGLGINIPLGKK